MNEFRAYTFGDLLTLPRTPKPTRIGVAEFCAESREIRLWVYLDGSEYYPIDLDTNLTLEAWLEHLNRKNWATSAVLGDLVKIWLTHV